MVCIPRDYQIPAARENVREMAEERISYKEQMSGRIQDALGEVVR